jgi:hypothetical protein
MYQRLKSGRRMSQGMFDEYRHTTEPVRIETVRATHQCVTPFDNRSIDSLLVLRTHAFDDTYQVLRTQQRDRSDASRSFPRKKGFANHMFTQLAQPLGELWANSWQGPCTLAKCKIGCLSGEPRISSPDALSDD